MELESVVASLTAFVCLVGALQDFVARRIQRRRLLGPHAGLLSCLALFLAGGAGGWLLSSYWRKLPDDQHIPTILASNATIADKNDRIDQLTKGPNYMPPVRAALFEHLQYQGARLYLPKGEYRDLARIFFDRKVSSLELQGVRATCYDEPDFRGESMAVDSDKPALMAEGWNDRIRSIRVEVVH